jgi:DNA polymerase V
MSLFALIDCNNFYASCERVFNPTLEKKPIIILSNNDGCVIARSNQAKELGIPMGAPYYQWRTFCRKNEVRIFSSNYALYADMSNRVMNILASFSLEIEIYSIDEAFILLDQFKNIDFFSYAMRIKEIVKLYTGIPVSIGLGPTKTLAKLANYIAKKHTQEGVFDLTKRDIQELILENFPVQDIWGIGHQLSKKMQSFRIKTAKELRDADLKLLRRKFSVVVEKIICELRGVSCLPLEYIQPRKQIMSSRSFGKPITDLTHLEEAVSHYTANACLKLRNQNGLAKGIAVFLQTNIFKEKQPQYGNSAAFIFPAPTADTAYMIRIAKKCLRHIYKLNYQYHKAGIMLLNISPQSIEQYDLLLLSNIKKTKRLTQTVDSINEKFGKNTLFYCAEGIKRVWKIKSDYRSPRYTTQWNELPKVIC